MQHRAIVLAAVAAVRTRLVIRTVRDTEEMELTPSPHGQPLHHPALVASSLAVAEAEDTQPLVPLAAMVVEGAVVSQAAIRTV